MKKPLFIVIFVMTVLLSGPVPECSAATWKWLSSLKGQPSGQSMCMPSALYIDHALERYYVVDARNNRLLSFNKDGEFLKEFNSEASGLNSFLLRATGSTIKFKGFFIMFNEI